MKKMSMLVVMSLLVLTISPVYALVMEDDMYTGGWRALWNQRMSWDLSVTGSDTVDGWWTSELTAPGAVASVAPLKYVVREEGNYAAGQPAADPTKYGIMWVDQTYLPDTAVIASYITPGLALGQESHGYQLYRPDVYSWEDKDYFKTDISLAAVNAAGASLVAKTYTYSDGNPWDGTATMNLIGTTTAALDGAGDGIPQEIKMLLAKPMDASGIGVWFEFTIQGGSAATTVFFNEINAVSDVATDGSYINYVVPEPATMVLLGLGSLIAVRRKK